LGESGVGWGGGTVYTLQTTTLNNGETLLYMSEWILRKSTG